MKTLKTIFVTLILLAILLPLAGLGFIYSGVYDVSATTHHNPVTRWLIGTTRRHSIKAHSQGLDAPALNDPKMIQTGFAHYNDDCAGCHGAPGVKQFEGAKDMYPSPPDLAEEAEEHSAEHLFWVIKHGLKMTGMPAWSPTHSDAQIWDMVAFLKQMSHMSAADYQRMQTSVGEDEDEDDDAGPAEEHPGDAVGHEHGEEHPGEPTQAHHDES